MPAQPPLSVGRDDSARRSITGGSPRGTRLRGGRPPKRGPMAAVGCTDKAKTGLALPPVFLAVSEKALPHPGWHASGLPCKP